jgi:hypothetical protein
MDTKLDCDCEVDVEGPVGAVDMMVRGEEWVSISRRPCLRPKLMLIQPTAHEPRGNERSVKRMPAPVGFHHVAPTTRNSPDQFPVHTFTGVQRPQPEERNDIPYFICSSELGKSPRAEQTIWNMCN